MKQLDDFQSQLNAVCAGNAKASPIHLDVAMQAVFLKLVAGFDELLCLPLVKIEQFPYQMDTARKALGRMKGRAILADEVGLGKSVEAGLVLKEAMVRSMVKNALILAPPSLLTQWQEELESKFSISTQMICSGSMEGWQTSGVLIASSVMAKRPVHAEALASRMFDLIIVDEAHHMRNRNTLLWKCVSRLKSKYLLLLTATPVQNSVNDLYNLITLLMPGQLATEKEFKERFVEKGTRGLSVHNVSELNALVSDVMVRNTRAEAGVEFPPRQAQTMIVKPTPHEVDYYQSVGEFLKKKNLSRMTILTASRMMGSLPITASALLDEIGIERPEVAPGAPSKILFLEKYLKRIWDEKPTEKILIFTQFTETHRSLVRHFDELCEVSQIIGGQDQQARNNEVVRFQASAPLLISTDAGSEGKNLQFCHRLVNFDIPWNPMRLEQRMGRLHRFGQTEPVSILNLCSQGSIEEVLLDLLDRKLNLFELVVGELSSVLGEIEDEKSFEEQVGDTWLGSNSMEIFREKMEGVSEKLIQARERLSKIQNLDKTIFS